MPRRIRSRVDTPEVKAARVTARSHAPTGELAETLKSVEKRYGAGTVASGATTLQPDRISTGSFMLDFSLLGGIPANRVTMAVGERHAGKSTVAAKIVRGAQVKYPEHTPVWLDIEGCYEPTWPEALGVDNNHLQVVHCETGEMAVDIVDAVIHSRETSLIVVDSLAALTPMKEIDSSAEDAHVGLQARLIGGMIRKAVSGMIAERKRGHYVTLLFLNQFRSKIGVSFGDPRSIPGGRAAEFCTSVQLIIKNKEVTGKDSNEVETVVENSHSYTIQKNKLNSGPRTGEFQLLRIDSPRLGLSTGDIDDAATMLSYAKKFGFYTGGGGSWTLRIWDRSLKFKNAEEAIIHLSTDREDHWSLRNFLIHAQAQHLGMPADFLASFLE